MMDGYQILTSIFSGGALTVMSGAFLQLLDIKSRLSAIETTLKNSGMMK
jgi:Pyruvate/2-oxoacid:ferredoxin oxidoreductase gamma subunit